MPDLTVALLWALGGAPLEASSAGPWALQAPGQAPWRPRGPVALKAEGGSLWAGGRRAAEWRLLAPGPWRLRGAGRLRSGVGPLRLVARQGRLVALARVPLEAWVAGVGAAEVDGPWPTAAREALAIAARSSAWAWRGRHRDAGFDLCDSTHCMAYRGLEAPDRAAEAAAEATDSLVLWAAGRVVPLPWHAACGGATAAPQLVFGGAMPGLPVGASDRRPDGRPWCGASPHAGPWRVWVGEATLAAALAKAGRWTPGWALPQLGTARLGEAGVALSVPLGEGRAVGGYALWQLLGAELGWGRVKSPAFQVRPGPGGAWLEGHGLGHLVGLCQWGSKGRAEAGWGRAAILKAFAPGLRVGRL